MAGKNMNTTRSATMLTAAAAILMVVALVIECADGQVSPMSSPPQPSMDGAPAPSLDCLTYLVNLSDCLTFVEAGSNLTKPDKGCCPELAGLVESQPICLCELLGKPGDLGVQIDLDKALKLPSVCSVSTPSVSLCAAVGIPVGALSPSEAPTPSAGDMSPTPAAGGVGPNSAPTFSFSHHLQFLVALPIALLISF